MEVTTIQIRVSKKAAQFYCKSSKEEQRKLDVLLSLRLCEMNRTQKPLEDVMDDISRNAQDRGITPEALESFLKT